MTSPSLYRWIAQLRWPELRTSFAIPTHLTDREKVTLFHLARSLSRSSATGIHALEIGAYLGASSAFLSAGLSKDSDRVVCVDTWDNDAMSEGQRDTQSEFVANTARYRDRITMLRGWSTSPEVLQKVRVNVGRIDLLFIDGDHSYEGAKADWEHYSPMLGKGAIVAMHDIGWAEGVKRVVAEHIRPRVVREQRLPNLWWGVVSP